MMAFLLHGAKDLRPFDLPQPLAGPGEVVIAMRRAGTCGSDMHYYSHGQVGSFVPKRPFVLGHEFAVEIVSVGFGVAPSRIDERVTVDPSMPCGHCGICCNGRHNLCLNMRFFGSASCDLHINGGLEEFVLAPAANAFAVPDTLSWGEAAMADLLSVAVHAARRAGNLAGQAVLVTGGVAIGQLAALVTRMFGAGRVVLSDILPGQRQFALDRAADGTLDALSSDFATKAEALAAGGFDVVIEAAGSVAALGETRTVIRRGGTIVQVDTLPASVTLPLNLIIGRELNLLGSLRFANVFSTAVARMASARIDVRPLIMSVYPLAGLGTAMQTAIYAPAGIKVQVAP